MEVRNQPRVPQEERPGFAPRQADGAYGELPACAPLANPYVPYQGENPPTYAAKKGLVRGTMFPGLDLPFMGMVNGEELPELPLPELQALCFAVVELGIYLDTHQEDEAVFALFQRYSELYKRAKKAYEEANGPLTQEAAAMDERYRWMGDPWPWDAPTGQDHGHHAACKEE